MILHKASMAGRLGEFFNALQYSQREIVLISHAGMYAMTPWLGKFIHYVIPDHDCWDRREAIGHVIQKAAEKDRILLFACSMPAKVWIRKAWNADGAAALIDVGSVFDPYINDNSRTYMQRSEHKLAAPLYDSPAKGNGNEVT